MKFAEALAAQPKHRHGPECSVCLLLESLEPDERADIQAAMESRIATSIIHRALRLAGHEISYSPVVRHRKGECSGIRR